ncbi:hypothetical protein PRIPAC_71643 [Pristionchus pacificus]|uniref:Uncharacterized protein n=1 Tax=Pristionchus pacificus TaxID=54126 RepID=A0A2A6CSU8_PRIPA|nr:hypothetical protein PRIPAC_71643 [Pristionchus pacificus]|eukprot:PDM81137.1 hypothetical protein PRIPAC_36140 [Pristionchus pacificus]
MLDVSHTTSAAPIRRFSLNLFSYFYWFIYCVGWMIVIKKKWNIVRFGWKQLISLLAIIYLDSNIRPHFKILTHFAKPLGLFYPKFFLAYAGVALVIAFITAYHIGNKVEHYCEKRQQLHMCAVVGAYYVGYYVSYSLLNILLISIDCSNLLVTVSHYIVTPIV